MLDAYYPWSEDSPKYQKRPPLDITPEQRDEFIRLQINAHHRNNPLIWHEKMVPEADDALEWVKEKLTQIEHAFLNKDELATIERLCTPFAGGRKWPVRGNPERWQLYALLFNRLMLNPSQTLKLGGQLPVSELVQTFSLIGQAWEEPLHQIVTFGTRVREQFLYGRPLTPEERKMEQRKTEQKRQDFELKRYGRILDPTERRQAARQEQIEQAEEAAHQAKLRALEAERRITQDTYDKKRVQLEAERQNLAQQLMEYTRDDSEFRDSLITLLRVVSKAAETFKSGTETQDYQFRVFELIFRGRKNRL